MKGQATRAGRNPMFSKKRVQGNGGSIMVWGCITSKGVGHLYCINGIEIQDWQPQSPDMNIIEHVWDYLDNCVHSRPHPPHNLDELWKVLEEEWYKIPKEYIDKLYKSLPKRVKAVIEAKGGNTAY